MSYRLSFAKKDCGGIKIDVWQEFNDDVEPKEAFGQMLAEVARVFHIVSRAAVSAECGMEHEDAEPNYAPTFEGNFIPTGDDSPDETPGGAI